MSFFIEAIKDCIPVKVYYFGSFADDYFYGYFSGFFTKLLFSKSLVCFIADENYSLFITGALRASNDFLGFLSNLKAGT